MGQKINPISLRLQQTNRHFNSCWYSDYYYSQLIGRDLNLQIYFNLILKQLKKPSGRFFIQNFQKKLKIHFFICNPKASRYDRSYFFRLPKSRKKVEGHKEHFDDKNKKTTTSVSHYKFKNIFLKQYSLGESTYTSYLTYLFGVYPKANFDGTLAVAKTKAQQISFHQSKRVAVEAKGTNNLTFFNQLSLRYILLTCFLRAQVNYSKDSHMLTYKKNKLQWLIKRSLIYLTTKYVKAKLSLDISAYPKSKNNKIQLEDEEKHIDNKLFRNCNFITKPLQQNISSQLNQVLKTINKKSINHINWVQRKVENSLFNSQAQEISFKNYSKRVAKDFFVIKNSPFREHLESVLSCFFQVNVNTFFYLIKNEKQSALFLADEIVYFLEKRILFRQIKNQILKEMQKQNSQQIQGIRISCSGRGGGKSKKAQRAKTQTFQFGQTSLHVFSSKIDFASKSAYTSFGQIGVKVWICYKD